MNDRRRFAKDEFGRTGRLHLRLLLFLLLAGGAFPAQLRWRGSYGELRVRPAHHLVGDSVRLVLKRIVELSDNEICLYGAWESRCSERGCRLRSVCPVR